MIFGFIALIAFLIGLFFLFRLVFRGLKQQREYERKRRQIMDYQLDKINKEKEEH